MMKLTKQQQRELEKLWFYYGNGGPKHTMGNHKFIQGLIERGEDHRSFYKQTRISSAKLTDECISKVDSILSEKGNGSN